MNANGPKKSSVFTDVAKKACTVCTLDILTPKCQKLHFFISLWKNEWMKFHCLKFHFLKFLLCFSAQWACTLYLFAEHEAWSCVWLGLCLDNLMFAGSMLAGHRIFNLQSSQPASQQPAMSSSALQIEDGWNWKNGQAIWTQACQNHRQWCCCGWLLLYRLH